MLSGKSVSTAIKTKVVVVTPDAAFGQSAKDTFAASRTIDLQLVCGALPEVSPGLDVQGATVVIIDVSAGGDGDMTALQSFMTATGVRPPVVAVTQSLDASSGASLARTLMQMKVADFLVKPVSPIDLVDACMRVARAPTGQQSAEAQIVTFLPAVGGAGVTTLAVQTAMLLLDSGARGASSTCLVDLDFQHGTCADHLDIEPRLNLDEIEPRPDRLDRQLLDVMISRHKSGLAVIGAPNRPAEMRASNPEMVTRLLDLVSSQFDYVVLDLPRTWFSWTDNVLLGSNQLYIVSETTVPGLRHAKQLVAAIGERLGDELNPKVIINRFDQRMFASGLRRADIEAALGSQLGMLIPNDYALVREAIDRGVPLDELKPGNKVTAQLRKLILPTLSGKVAASPKAPLLSKLKLVGAR